MQVLILNENKKSTIVSALTQYLQHVKSLASRKYTRSVLYRETEQEIEKLLFLLNYPYLSTAIPEQSEKVEQLEQLTIELSNLIIQQDCKLVNQNEEIARLKNKVKDLELLAGRKNV